MRTIQMNDTNVPGYINKYCPAYFTLMLKEALDARKLKRFTCSVKVYVSLPESAQHNRDYIFKSIKESLLMTEVVKKNRFQIVEAKNSDVYVRLTIMKSYKNQAGRQTNGKLSECCG